MKSSAKTVKYTVGSIISL